MESNLDPFPSEDSRDAQRREVPAPPPDGDYLDLLALALAPRAKTRLKRRGHIPRKMLEGIAAACRTLGEATAAGLRRVVHALGSVREDRLAVFAIAAFTSAGVSLLTLTVWSVARPPYAGGVPAVTNSTAAELAESQSAPAPATAPAPSAVPAPPAASPLPVTPLNSGRVRFKAAVTATRPPAPVVVPPSSQLASSLPDRAKPARPAKPAAVTRTVTGADPSSLVVITEPEGARVTINNLGWGTTPLTVANLPRGLKRVRVTRSGYHSEERVLSADGGAVATLHIVLREAPQDPR